MTKISTFASRVVFEARCQARDRLDVLISETERWLNRYESDAQTDDDDRKTITEARVDLQQMRAVREQL